MATVIRELDIETGSAPSDELYEIVDGKVVEKQMGVLEVHVTNLITFFLTRFAFDHQLGYVQSEMLFDLGTNPKSKRRPDIAFLSHQRWPKGRKFPSGNAFKVVPDLAVEVVSPMNSANEVEEKIVEYFEAGVRLVWIVYPTTSRVHVHDGSNTVRVFSRADELDGGDVLPGFSLPLADIFEDEAEVA